MEEEITISWSEITNFLKKRVLMILVCGLVAMVGAFTYSRYFIDKVYTADVSMYVAPNADEINRTASLSELNYAQAVVDTYIEILKTNSFLTDVAVAADLDYTPSQLRSRVSMRAQNGTEIFKIAVSSNKPDEAVLIAETIADLAPQKIIEIKDADAVRVVDPPILPQNPSSPNVMQNTVIGLMLGIFLGFSIAFVLEFMDGRVKGADDLERHYKLPVFGTVPYKE